MKHTTLAGRILVSLCLLMGCGGSSDGGGGGGDTGVPCTSQAQCDDGLFCTGVETCTGGTCHTGTPPCSDSDACTAAVCSEVAQTCRTECQATGPTDACCNAAVCVDDDNCPFSGGSFLFNATGLTQQPQACFVPSALVALILPLLTGTDFPVDLPPQSAFPTVIDLNVPLLGTLDIPADFDAVNDEILFGPVQTPVVDLSRLNIPGLNCAVSGTAEGETIGLTQLHIPASIRLTDLTVATGGGTGACSLKQPVAECTLTVPIVGDQTGP
jgi:hypothetical protein